MPKAYIIAGRAITYRRYITRDRRERILLQKISFVYLTKEIFHKVEARQSKPNTPSSDKETSLHLLPGIWLPGLPGCGRTIKKFFSPF